MKWKHDELGISLTGKWWKGRQDEGLDNNRDHTWVRFALTSGYAFKIFDWISISKSRKVQFLGESVSANEHEFCAEYVQRWIASWKWVQGKAPSWWQNCINEYSIRATVRKVYEKELGQWIGKGWLILKSFNCSPPVLSLSVSFLSLLLSLAESIHWFAQFCCLATKYPSRQCFLYTGFGRLQFAYVANPVPPETRRMTYKLHSQRRLHFRFFILQVLYTQDTFAPFGNFQVSHFARHFLFLSFGVAMKGIQFTKLRCHISFLSFTRFITCFFCFFFCPAEDDCWFHVNVWGLKVFRRSMAKGKTVLP